MAAYINQLIITVVVCQAATMISPDSENARKYIRIICSLVVILTIISPVRTIVDHAGEIAESFTNFFSAAENEEVTVRDSLESAAYTILAYAEEKYDIDASGAMVSFKTGEDGEVNEVQIFLESCEDAVRQKFAAELEEELGMDVHIFIEKEVDDA